MKKKIRIILQICPVLLLGIFVWLGPTTKGEKTQYQKKYEKIESSKKGENLELVKEVAQEANTKYKDGVFQGSAKGYSGTVTVEVEIKNSKITSIKVLRNSDTPSFFGQAKSKVIDAIISAQNTKVDVVTGATYSSKGIINAVKNALKTATIKKKNNANQTVQQAPIEQQPVPKYKDGVYEAIVACDPGNSRHFKKYDLHVKVEIKDGKITDISEIYGTGRDYIAANLKFINKAAYGADGQKGIIDQISEIDTLDKVKRENIDKVSHATFSSNSIIEAIEKCLEQAKES